MNPIRDFFMRKKADQNFKKAGPAHRLNEAPKPLQPGENISSASGFNKPSNPRLSKEAERAAAAALARIEQKQPANVNWSLQATKMQARKELELENAVKVKETTGPKEVIQDACPALTVSGVYFTCPMIGPEILPKKEIENKIKEFLYAQLEQERGLTSCLIIHTLNKNKEKVHLGIETLARYLTNILDNPEEEKYRRIRFKNKIFQERVLPLEGAFDFLVSAGFIQETVKSGEEEEEYFVFPKENLENLQMLKEALLSAEPIVPVLDRNLKVLKPSVVTEKVQLPNDFFNLSAEELKREQEAKAEAVELMTQLRTKSMRKKDEIKELHVYKFTLIRIRFPDGIILQGTFYVYEKLLAVKNFIMENLAEPQKQFNLLLPGGFRLTDDEQSLLELKLVPAVILNFQWLNESSTQNVSYLKHETLSLLSYEL
ncbi:UBX domain-containing protein 6-like [Stegodyphus dumicola]|uniref:UBX domain-containing protein 6-like n=1 Tax=Stegodyphus dumicola TaxID=202533 RepID=UPI0015B10F47|nr:UBX domain-containing protein 6-like [Stegodyphus dumicola]XP_035209031.1 UBX domain-containing protein 6-like [Stegodyphus dumicola]